MKRAAAAVLLLAGACSLRAAAAEFSAKGSLQNSVETSNNYFLQVDPTGYTAKPLSRIDLDFLAATPTTRYGLNTDYSYYHYFGPGAQNQALKYNTPSDVVFNVDNKPDTQTKLNLNAAWNHRDLATTLLTENGVAAGRGSVDTFRFTTGGTRAISHVDTVSWNVKASTISYSDPTQTPYWDYATNVSLYHRISASTVLTNTISFDYLSLEDAAKSQRLFWNPMTGFQTQLTKRLNVVGQIGAAFANAYQLNPIQIPAGNLVVTPGASQSVVGNLTFSYKLTPSDQALLKLSRSIVPNVLGSLEQIDSLGLTVVHNINHASRLTFLTQYSHQQLTGTISDFITAAVTYDYRLSREWRTSVSVAYRQRDNITGIANAGSLLVSLTRDFNVYGKPPPTTSTTGNTIAAIQQQQSNQALPGIVPYSAPDANTQEWPDLTPNVVPSTDF